MKIKKCFDVFILAVISALIFFACFNDRQGKEASIILNLGKNAGNRAAWPHEENPDILDNILYKVVIDGPDHIEIESTGIATIKTTVTPGIYTITVEAHYLSEPYAKYSVENITIKAGANFVPISLKPWNEIPDMDPTKTYLIAEGIKMEFNSLSIALRVAKTNPEIELEGEGLEGLIGLGLKEFTVSIGDDYHYLNNDTGGSIFEGEKVIIKKHGNGTACIKPGDPESGTETRDCIFSVNGELTLKGNITLEGVKNNYYALIVVNKDGIFNMYDNVKITENKNDLYGGYGGGVYVCNGGTFTMEGGTISGNEAYYWGGGVYVDVGGTFIMKKGIIHGNKAQNGGGVCVFYDDENGGNFFMNNGEISGNEATRVGGGVYIFGSALFVKTQGTIYGTNANEGKRNIDSGGGGADSVFLGSNSKGITTTIDEPLDNYPSE
jgi:hypothetical protein